MTAPHAFPIVPLASEFPILRRHWGGIKEELAARQRRQRLVDHQPERAAITRLAPAPSAPTPAHSANTMIINTRKRS